MSRAVRPDPPFDEHLFRELYDRTGPRLRRHLARETGRPDVADELVQETFVRLLVAAPSFDSNNQVTAWLYRTARNLMIDRWRRIETESRGERELFRSESHNHPSPFSDVERAMERISPRDRELLWLAHVEGFTHAEISGIIGVRAKSVRVLLHRARRRLAETLKAMDRGGSDEV